MTGFDLLISNFTSPIVLAFALGVVAALVKSELELPEPVLKLISIFLLFSIGLNGGHELAKTELAEVGPLLLLTVGFVVGIPMMVYLIGRRLIGLDVSNAAALAAHYGSVSSVTFFAALAFANAAGTPGAGFLPAVVALMEWGVIVALVLARINDGEKGSLSIMGVVQDTLRGRGIILLSGGMTIGALASDAQFAQIEPLYSDLFRGVLMLFLIEMGMTAQRRFGAFREIGARMIAFGIVTPVLVGVVATTAATMVGADVGTAFVFGAICASSSYIDAPAACRAALPQSNPGIYLTSSLGVTFPFNLLVGLPLYYAFAAWLAGVV